MFHNLCWFTFGTLTGSCCTYFHNSLHEFLEFNVYRPIVFIQSVGLFFLYTNQVINDITVFRKLAIKEVLQFACQLLQWFVDWRSFQTYPLRRNFKSTETKENHFDLIISLSLFNEIKELLPWQFSFLLYSLQWNQVTRILGSSLFRLNVSYLLNEATKVKWKSFTG